VAYFVEHRVSYHKNMLEFEAFYRHIGARLIEEAGK